LYINWEIFTSITLHTNNSNFLKD